MTAMATLWQANDGFRPSGALFFEINGILDHAHFSALMTQLKFDFSHISIITVIIEFKIGAF